MKLYPDEILLSALARYHHISGQKRVKPTIRRLYGNDCKKISVDLPSSIEALWEHRGIRISPLEAIEKHTLFPFYRPFLSKRQVGSIQQAMLQGNGTSVHLTSGIMASVVKINYKLRLCPVCIKQDIQNYGEPYWHRIHQLPGVLVCPKHCISLLSHCPICNVALSAENSRHFSITSLFCRNGHDLNINVKNEDNQFLIFLAKGLLNLFEQCAQNKIPADLRSSYINKLKEINLCTPNNRVRQKEVISRFANFVTPSELCSIGVPIPDGQNNWLSTILRKPRKSFHPLLHALMILFLWGETASIPKDEELKPFGNGPWPCLNKITTHYKERTIHEVQVTRCSDTKKPVGTFHCKECGFKYSRRGPDKQKEDEFTYGRIKDFGHEWRSKLESFLIGENSIRSIARELKADSKTIKNHLLRRQHKPNEDWLKKLELRRSRMLQTINESNGSGITQIRRKNLKDYYWLYKHDSLWLKTVLPQKKKSHNRSKRIDWVQRDEEIASLIIHSILDLYNQNGKPIRITTCRVGRMIGKLTLLERHLDKLSICRNILQNNVESEEQHQIRKIEWAHKYLIEMGRRPVRWRVLREAGIRKIKSNIVNQYLAGM